MSPDPYLAAIIITMSHLGIVYSMFCVGYGIYTGESSNAEYLTLVLMFQWLSQNFGKKYAHQGETTVSSNDSLQLCPFSKCELLLKERICSQRERILFFMGSSL